MHYLGQIYFLENPSAESPRFAPFSVRSCSLATRGYALRAQEGTRARREEISRRFNAFLWDQRFKFIRVAVARCVLVVAARPATARYSCAALLAPLSGNVFAIRDRKKE